MDSLVQFRKNTSTPLLAQLDEENLIILPIQRAPRYILLLTQLCKSHIVKDFSGQLERALEATEAVTDDLNEAQRSISQRVYVSDFAAKIKEMDDEKCIVELRSLVETKKGALSLEIYADLLRILDKKLASEVNDERYNSERKIDFILRFLIDFTSRVTFESDAKKISPLFLEVLENSLERLQQQLLTEQSRTVTLKGEIKEIEEGKDAMKMTKLQQIVTLFHTIASLKGKA
jgi:hypothetical protein